MLNALARLRSLSVIGRGSSFIYKGSGLDIEQIALDTGVRYIARGAVRRAGRRIRVTAQLIEAGPGDVIWSEAYDRDIGDIFELQDEITQCIVTGLVPEIGAHERRITRRKPTNSLSAWELCQRGLTQLDRRGPESVIGARRFFHMAAEADPTYALPRALLARLHAVRIFSGRSIDPAADIAEGMHHATAALEMDDRLEFGHQAMAQLLLVQGREAEAREVLSRAKALNDNDAFTYSAQTFINLFQSEPDTEEMEAAGLTALRLNPKDPLAWSYYWMLVMAIWLRDGELGENVRHYLDPASRQPAAEAFVHVACAVTALKRDDRDAAKRALDRALEMRPELTVAIIRYAFHFPKWPELVAGVAPQLEELTRMGLPRE